LFFSDDNISYKKCTSFVLERGEKSNIEGLPFWEFRFTKLHKYARYIKIHSKFKDDQWSWINYADRIIEVQGPNIKGTWFPSRRTTNKSYRNNFHFPPFGSTSCDAIVNSCNSSSSSCANASFDEKLFPVILQKLKSARILWHKIDYFDQNYLEPSEGVYNFALFDKIVSMHTIYGIQMLGSFNKLARWNAGKPNHAEWWHMEPADYNKYKDFVGVTVNRYKDQIKHWEGWNEINWQWTDQMGKMVDLQRCIYDGVKGADPNATVLCGGFSGTGIYQVERFISQGGGDYMDAFGGHFYARDPNASLKKTLAARGILDYYGYSGMPIWVTELGWSSGPWPELGSSIRVADETTKAKYLVKTLDLLLPHVQVFLWYSSVEPWTDPNQRMFGPLGADEVG
jgi:hypothetical protein